MTNTIKSTLLIVAYLVFLVASPAQAVNPDEIMADPNLETRARQLSKDLRCVVCRNQSIDDSNAGVARDMRIALRERLLAGDNDAQAVQYLVDRYGEFVLLKPPLKPVTYLLWGAPGLLLLVTFWGFSRLWRNRDRDSDFEEPISLEDRAYIASILKDDEEQL